MGVTMGDAVIPRRSAAPPVPPQAPAAQPLPPSIPAPSTPLLGSAPPLFSDHVSLGVGLTLSAPTADSGVTHAFNLPQWRWPPRLPDQVTASYFAGAPLSSVHSVRPVTFGLGADTPQALSFRERFSAALSGPLQSFEFQSTPTSMLGFSGGLSVGWFDGRIGVGLIAGIPGLGSGILSYKPGFLMPAPER